MKSLEQTASVNENNLTEEIVPTDLVITEIEVIKASEGAIGKDEMDFAVDFLLDRLLILDGKEITRIQLSAVMNRIMISFGKKRRTYIGTPVPVWLIEKVLGLLIEETKPNGKLEGCTIHPKITNNYSWRGVKLKSAK